MNATDSAADSPTPQLNLEGRKQAILRLRTYQQELRMAVQAKIPAGMKITDAARMFDVNWTQMSNFLSDGRPACGGEILDKLTSKVGRPDLKTSIMEAVETISSDHMLGVSAYAEPIIGIYFELHTAVIAGDEGIEKFARSRGEFTDSIRKLFWGNKEVLDRLRDDHSFSEKFQESIRSQGQFVAPAAVQEFRSIQQQLRGYFQHKQDLADALDVRREFLNTDSDKYLGPVLDRARSLLASKRQSGDPSPEPATPPVEAIRSETTPAVSAEGAQALMNSAISALHSILNMLETISKNPEVAIDGNRMQAVHLAKRLLTAFGIDKSTLHRLRQVEALNPAEIDLLAEAFGAASPSIKRSK